MRILFKRHLRDDLPVIQENWPDYTQTEGMRAQLLMELEEAFLATPSVTNISRRVEGNTHPGRRHIPPSMVYYDFTIDFPKHEKTDAEICDLFDGVVYGKWEILETQARDKYGDNIR